MSGRARLLVTRPQPEARETAGRLEALGIEAIVAPLMVFEPVMTDFADAGHYVAIALTSANGLRGLAYSGDLSAYFDLPVFCVGPHSAQVAREAGFEKITAVIGGVAGLAERLGSDFAAGRVFYPSADEIAADLQGLLPARSLEIARLVTYRMRAVAELPSEIVTQLFAGEVRGGLFYSRRAAEAFARLVPGLDGFSALCLSRNVAGGLASPGGVGSPGGLSAEIAARADEEAMMQLALGFADRQIR